MNARLSRFEACAKRRVPRPALRRRSWALASAFILVPLTLAIASVRAPSLTADQATAPPAGAVKVSGTGFAAGEQIELFLDSVDVERARASTAGALPATSIRLPTFAVAGAHWVTAIGQTSQRSAQVVVTVTSDWPQEGFDATRASWSAAEPSLTRDTIGTLAEGWDASLGSQPSASSPVVAGGVVYVGGSDGSLYAFAASGCGSSPCAPLWFTQATGGPIQGAPAVADGSVFVGSGDRSVYAYAESGCGSSPCAPLWKSPGTIGPIDGSPAVGVEFETQQTRVFVGSENGKVYALDAASGAIVWSRSEGSPIDTTPALGQRVVSDRTLVFVTTSNGTLFALRGSNGNRLWSAALAAADPSSPAVAVSRVIVADGGQLEVFNAGGCRSASCSSLWTGSLGGNASTDPSVAGGIVYEGSSDQDVEAFNLAGCQVVHGICSPLHVVPLGNGPPIGSASVADGRVFVRTADGSLTDLEIENPPAAAGRPDPAALQVLSTPIRHVVVIFQENHSFNNVLGKLCLMDARQDCTATSTGTRSDGSTVTLTQTPDVVPHVGHNNKSQSTALDGGLLDGFDKIGGCQPRKNLACYSYYAPDQIPNIAVLARTYAISDHTFEDAVTATFGAHMALASSTLDGFVGDFPKDHPDYPPGPGWGCDSLLEAYWHAQPADQPALVPSCVPAGDGTGPYKTSPVTAGVPTIMDRIDAAGMSWRIYASTQVWSRQNVWSTCPTFGECMFGPQAANMSPALSVQTDGQDGTLPSLSLVMPRPGGFSQHNGTSMVKGDNWIGHVVSSIAAGPDWDSTAIFLTWDDCGCFYDEVAPPAGSGWGLRLPMVIVSPYAKAGYTDTTPTPLSGMLAFTEHAFGLAPLSSHDAQAYDFENSFDFTMAPRIQAPKMVTTVLPLRERQFLARHPPPPVDPV
jgi:phospholipase C/outer membrane protein assembly factor BamB